MMKYFSVFVLLIFMVTACSHAPPIPHPPRFEHIIQAKSFFADGYSDQDFAYMLELSQALAYTPQDLAVVLSQEDPTLLIGAVYQMNDRREALQILARNLPMIWTNPLALSLFISYALQESPVDLTVDIDELLEAFIHLAPENSFPYYLKAYARAKQELPEMCLAAVQQGNAQNTFNNYFQDLSQLSIATSEFLGYSPFAARHHALGQQHDIMIYHQLTKFLLAALPEEQTFNHCYLLGQRLKTESSTHIFDLVAIGIQRLALEHSSDTQAQTTLHELEQQKQAIHDMLTKFYAIADTETSTISEQRWIQYFDELYAFSEAQAMETLFDEYSSTIDENVMK
jgi:hypothetical protein